MIYHKIVFIILLSLVAADAIIPQKIRFKHLSEEDGLSHRAINCAIEDNMGFLWFGTENGLNRFDNYNFRVFQNIPGDTNSLSDNNIWSLLEDSLGNIWAGTQNGILNCYDPRIEKFKQYKIDKDKNLNGNSITCLYEGKYGILWIGTYKGGLYSLDVYSGKVLNWQSDPSDAHSLSNKFVTSLYEDNEGRMWVGTYNGLCLFNKDHTKFTQFFNDPSDQNTLSDNIVWEIYPSKSNPDYVWIGTFNGLTYLNIKEKRFTQFIPDRGNPNKFSRSISSMCEDFTDGNKILWAGTYEGLIKIKLPQDMSRIGNGSVYHTNINQINFVRWINNPDDRFSINNNHINNLLIDRSGVLWAAGEDGIDYYPKQKDKFNDNNFTGWEIKNVQAVCESEDKIVWLGTNSGIYSIEDKAGKYKLTYQPSFLNQNIWSLTTGRNNDIWIGTYGNGLEHLDPRTGRITAWKGNWTDTADIGNPYVRAVYQDSSGFVWLGFWGVGLNRLDPATGRILRWNHDKSDPLSLSYDDVWVIYGDSRGRIWIGTYGGGLNLFDSTDGGIFHKWLFNENNLQGLTSNNILSICEARNNENNKTILWIGTTQGLNKIIITNLGYHGKQPAVEFRDYPSRDLLRTRTINSVIEDFKGRLWLTTNKGLIHFDPETGSIEAYTTFDGLQSNQFNPNAAYQSSSGEIYAGSIGGLNVFYPDSIRHSVYTVPIVFTDFLIFNQKVEIGPFSPLKSSINTSKELVLSYDQNVFSFQFASLDYNASGENQYAYKMEGFDKDWIYSGTRHFVTYTNLFPGTYTFKVRGTNSDGVWNASPAEILITITPPFWGTWWFGVLVVLLLLAALYFLYRIRLKRLLELERLRVKIASDLHDDIGSALTRISIESELLNTNIDTRGSRESLKRIGIMSREIITTMSDVVWSIDSRNDSIEDLLNRMKDFSFSLFSLKNTRVQFDTKNLDMSRKLKVDLRQNIYLIFKEAIINAAKYSASDQIFISLMNKEGKFIMTIDDPAALFSPQKLTGHGLRNMQMRAARVKGNIEFISVKGLKVIFTCKEI